MLEYKVIALNEENIIALENLRFKVYDYKTLNQLKLIFIVKLKMVKYYHLEYMKIMN